MSISKTNLLSNLYTTLFALYFIFNFFDRSIANIFLLFTLLFCVLDYKNLYVNIKNNSKLVISIIVFSIYVSLIGYYHGSPLHELDNYYRFLLLLPLLLIPFNESRFTLLIFVCAMVGLFHAIYNEAYYGIHLYPENIYRYAGTSSTAITYSNMCATLLMICMYYIFYKNNKSLRIILSALIFLILFVLTETRGPIIGIMLVLIYLAYVIKSNRKNIVNFKQPLIAMFIFLVSIFVLPNPIGESIQKLKTISFSEPSAIESASLKARTLFLKFGAEKVKNNFLTGVGPQNVRSEMSEYFERYNVSDIASQDHVHNEFLDIVLKYGIAGLIFLFLIYFYLLNTKNSQCRVLINIMLIMLISSQLTQSQFSHHQAITFFIALFYLFQKKDTPSRQYH